MTSDTTASVSRSRETGRRRRRVTGDTAPAATSGATPKIAAPTTTRRPGARAHNRRGEILDAAARLFARQGFHAASMREIAAAAGMLPGSLYYHFPSKDELLLAVYE